jgi:dipeptidase
MRRYPQHRQVRFLFFHVSIVGLLLFFLAGTVLASTSSYLSGTQFGRTYRVNIMKNISALKETSVQNAIEYNRLKAYAKVTENLYRSILPEKIEWIRGVADGAQIPYEDVLIFNTADRGIKGFQGECTTVMVNGKALKAGKGSIVAKNRDLGTNTISEIGLHHAAELPKSSIYRAAYIDIPNVKATYKFIGSRTAGRWGYGMGINEHQVAVADNDAPSRDNMDWKAGLHDNDIVRLVLERAKTAREGMEIATKLAETYGQAWNGIMFEIGDPNEIWVVEVTGRRWAAKRYTDTVTVRTNQYQLTDDYDMASKDLVSFAIEKGWAKKNTKRINFRKVYGTDTLYPDDNKLENRKSLESIYSAKMRYARAMKLMKSLEGSVDVGAIPRIMRDHYDTYTLPSGKTITMDQVPFYSSPFADWKKREWVVDKPGKDDVDVHMYVRGICGHDIGWLRTASSAIMVARPYVPGDLALMLHAFMNPCQSTYVPFYAGITELDPRFSTLQAAVTFEAVRTRAFGNYTLFHKAIRKAFDPYETRLFSGIPAIEKQFVDLSAEGKKKEASAALTSYVLDRSVEVLHLAESAQDNMSREAYNAGRWSR